MLPGASKLLALLIWASQISGLPIPQDVPKPVVIETLAMVRGIEAAGEFRYEQNTIAINENVKWQPYEQECVIAHEYTHWLQWANRWPMEDSKVTEPLAYLITASCMAYHQNDDYVKWAIKMSSECTTKKC